MAAQGELLSDCRKTQPKDDLGANLVTEAKVAPFAHGKSGGDKQTVCLDELILKNTKSVQVQEVVLDKGCVGDASSHSFCNQGCASDASPSIEG